jgi:uncharacterized protein YbjT (DUF2867 family)
MNDAATNRAPVAVTGATGFIGRYLTQALVERGRPVRALARDARKAGRVLPQSDQVEIVEGDIFDAASLDELCAGADAVVHLIGIRCEKRPAVTFERLHVEATKNAISAAKRAEISRYLQMSALGTRPEARSAYHQTKFAAEQAVRASGLDWTIIRPSLVIGPDGEFLQMARGWATGDEQPYLFMPYFESPRAMMKEAPIPGTSEKPVVQPVMVEDVAEAFCRAIEREDAIGEVYPIGGPTRYEWPEMLEEIRKTIPGKARPVWGIPAEVGEITARVASIVRMDQLLPFCLSDVQMASEDNACSNARLVADLDLAPRPVSFAG